MQSQVVNSLKMCSSGHIYGCTGGYHALFKMSFNHKSPRREVKLLQSFATSLQPSKKVYETPTTEIYLLRGSVERNFSRYQ